MINLYKVLDEIPTKTHPKPIPEAAAAVQSAQSALLTMETRDNGHRPQEKEHKEAAAPGVGGCSPGRVTFHRSKWGCNVSISQTIDGKWLNIGMSIIE